jgi:hypothetical protein
LWEEKQVKLLFCFPHQTNGRMGNAKHQIVAFIIPGKWFQLKGE